MTSRICSPRSSDSKRWWSRTAAISWWTISKARNLTTGISCCRGACRGNQSAPTSTGSMRPPRRCASIRAAPTDPRASAGERPGRRLDEQILHVAEAPILARLEAAHHRMLRLVEMLRGVPVGGIVATADMTTLDAEAQMHPLVAARQTLLATVGCLGLDVPDLREMLALLGHARSSSVGC